MIFGINITRDISKLSQISYNNCEISHVVFMPNITTNHAITYTNKSRGRLFLTNQQQQSLYPNIWEAYFPRVCIVLKVQGKGIIGNWNRAKCFGVTVKRIVLPGLLKRYLFYETSKPCVT